MIDDARLECEKTLSQIAALESVLAAQGDTRGPTNITAHITNILPTDRPFTSPDIVAALEKAHPVAIVEQAGG